MSEDAKNAGSWETDPRWQGVRRTYSTADVVRLRGSVHVEHTLARRGAERLWELLHSRTTCRPSARSPATRPSSRSRPAQGHLLSGWQVAADANLAGQMYPDQSLYPVQQRAGPRAAHQQRLAAGRPDPARRGRERRSTSFAPIVADAEAGFGGAAQRLRAHEGDDRSRRRRRSTSRTSSPARRSAATWGARCSSPPRSSSARSTRRGWPPTSWTCPPC